MTTITYSYFCSGDTDRVYDGINFTKPSPSQILRRNNWLDPNKVISKPVLDESGNKTYAENGNLIEATVENRICIEQDFIEGTTDEVFKKPELLERSIDTIVEDLAACRLVVRDNHLKTLHDRRKEIKYGYATCDCTGGIKTILMNKDNREYLGIGFPVIN